MTKFIHHNNPIAKVIRNYTDKKSGMVTLARSEIKRRFAGLDWTDQRKIMAAFLDSGATDRQWACTRLLDLWDPSLEERVRQLWEEYHEERCAWVIIRHFPADYVREHADELGEDRNYYFICRRLASDPAFAIDRKRLGTTDYLMAMFHAGRHVDDREASEILYGTVMETCLCQWPVLELSRFYHVSREEMMLPSDFMKVSEALYYLVVMGNDEAVGGFRRWERSVRKTCMESVAYKELARQPLTDHDYKERLADIVSKNMFLALPPRYKTLSDHEYGQILKNDIIGLHTDMDTGNHQ